eukprot:CAMPEP_0113579096 /NCGR_PEP_ID=MMETSP0015_2-20120614/29878_1 /TAXON_ID=2838 /ORGANISM="Odontella" /LENGTH=51 /DNA_ID=CAMNT_0000483037 /DNA_START=220 /DNA_END=375 /DNA_ORIENTATION=- /assembly_acc=CAM_ASM_000160
MALLPPLRHSDMASESSTTSWYVKTFAPLPSVSAHDKNFSISSDFGPLVAT